MKYFFGLGNPGDKYQKTRHNAGFMLIDFLAQELFGSNYHFSEQTKLRAQVFKDANLVLAKPVTFMNDSGHAVQAVTAYFKSSEADGAAARKNLVVAHDDLDLAMGECKLQFGRGPKTHNGLQSIYQTLKTDQFWHLRIGIDDRQGDRSIPPANYVLAKLMKHDLMIMEQAFARAMNLLRQNNLIK